MKNQKEKTIAILLQEYKSGEISIGKIVDNLSLDREEVLALLEKYNIDLVDYSWEEEKENIESFLDEIEVTKSVINSKKSISLKTKDFKFDREEANKR